MPRTKNPDKYPNHFNMVLMAAYNAHAPMPFKCESEGAAKRMRMQLYAYIRALEADEEARGVSRPLRESLLFHKVSFKVEQFTPDSFGLLFTNINANAEALAMRTFLAENPHLDTTNHEAEAHKAAAIVAMEGSNEVEHADLTVKAEPSLAALFTKPGDT